MEKLKNWHWWCTAPCGKEAVEEGMRLKAVYLNAFQCCYFCSVLNSATCNLLPALLSVVVISGGWRVCLVWGSLLHFL